MTRPPLRLTFDINKTLNFVDSVKGETLEHAVTRMLCDTTWGYKRTSPDGTIAWEWDGQAPTMDRPQNWQSGDLRICYRDFLEEKFPGERKRQTKDQIKFHEPGQPGYYAMLTSFHTRYIDALKLSDQDREKAKQIGLGDLLKESYFILPAFFKLLKYLRDSNREFSITFRTFGEDLKRVATEFNAFCTGNHPLSHGFEMPEKCLLSSYMLSFVRQDFEPRLTLLSGTDIDFQCDPHILSHYRSQIVKSGVDEVLRFLNEIASKGKTLGIRDMFDYWKLHNREVTAGKPCYVDMSGKNHHTIFFDDNVKENDAYIVDMRDETTGEPLPFSETNGVFLVRVVPFEMLLDENYYIKCLEDCEEN